jgi:hypothetical protein
VLKRGRHQDVYDQQRAGVGKSHISKKVFSILPRKIELRGNASDMRQNKGVWLADAL